MLGSKRNKKKEEVKQKEDVFKKNTKRPVFIERVYLRFCYIQPEINFPRNMLLPPTKKKKKEKGEIVLYFS